MSSLPPCAPWPTAGLARSVDHQAPHRPVRRALAVDTAASGRLERLTERERDVVPRSRAVEQRRDLQELFIGAATVKSHVSNISPSSACATAPRSCLRLRERLVEPGDVDIVAEAGRTSHRCHRSAPRGAQAALVGEVPRSRCGWARATWPLVMLAGDQLPGSAEGAELSRARPGARGRGDRRDDALALESSRAAS